MLEKVFVIKNPATGDELWIGEEAFKAVSYTHLTLPTSELV